MHKQLGPGTQRADSAIQRINRYPGDKCLENELSTALSTEQRFPL